MSAVLEEWVITINYKMTRHPFSNGKQKNMVFNSCFLCLAVEGIYSGCLILVEAYRGMESIQIIYFHWKDICQQFVIILSFLRCHPYDRNNDINTSK